MREEEELREFPTNLDYRRMWIELYGLISDSYNDEAWWYTSKMDEIQKEHTTNPSNTD